MSAPAREGRELRAGTRKSYSGLDEGARVEEDPDPPPQKKRGRPPSLGGPKKKLGRPPKVATPMKHRPLDPPPCGEERLSHWRRQLEALPDDDALHATGGGNDEGTAAAVEASGDTGAAAGGGLGVLGFGQATRPSQGSTQPAADPRALLAPPEAVGHLLQVSGSKQARTARSDRIEARSRSGRRCAAVPRVPPPCLRVPRAHTHLPFLFQPSCHRACTFCSRLSVLCQLLACDRWRLPMGVECAFRARQRPPITAPPAVWAGALLLPLFCRPAAACRAE